MPFDFLSGVLKFYILLYREKKRFQVIIMFDVGSHICCKRLDRNDKICNMYKVLFFISLLSRIRINKQRLQDEQILDELDQGEQSLHEPDQGKQHLGEQHQGVQHLDGQHQDEQHQGMPVQLASSSCHSQKPCIQPHMQNPQEHRGMLH